MIRRVIQIKNQFAELERARREATRLLESEGLGPHSIRIVNLGLEEVITNILKYGYDDDREHSIQITFRLTAAELQMAVVDDGHEFDPLEHPEPAPNQPLENREPGGLGICFLRKFFDEVQYRREAGKNSLTLRKRLPARNR